MPFGSNPEKLAVQEFWNRRSSGEVYATADTPTEQLDSQARARYYLEPYISGFARFGNGQGRDVLEIGVGTGVDHLQWAKSSPRSLTGIDLTPRAIEHTRGRLEAYGLTSRLECADAEHLPFPDDSFESCIRGCLAPFAGYPTRRRRSTPRPAARWRRACHDLPLLVDHRLLALASLRSPSRAVAAVRVRQVSREPRDQGLYDRRSRAPVPRLQGRVRTLAAVIQRLVAGCRGTAAQRPSAEHCQTILWPRPFIRRLMPRHRLMLLVEARKSPNP